LLQGDIVAFEATVGGRSAPKWYVKYQENGRQKMVRARVTSKKKAAGFLRAAEERVADGLVGVERRGSEKTFAELAAHWLKTHSATLTSHGDNVGRMKHLTAELGKLPVSGVSAEKVALLRARMVAEVSDGEGRKVQRWKPNTVNRTLALLRKVIRRWSPSSAIAWASSTACAGPASTSRRAW
jgi:hypothetical protein